MFQKTKINIAYVTYVAYVNIELKLLFWNILEKIKCYIIKQKKLILNIKTVYNNSL